MTTDQFGAPAQSSPPPPPHLPRGGYLAAPLAAPHLAAPLAAPHLAAPLAALHLAPAAGLPLLLRGITSTHSRGALLGMLSTLSAPRRVGRPWFGLGFGVGLGFGWAPRHASAARTSRHHSRRSRRLVWPRRLDLHGLVWGRRGQDGLRDGRLAASERRGGLAEWSGLRRERARGERQGGEQACG